MTPTAKDVLIVDDDDATRNVVCAALTRSGMSCDTATDGVEAVDLLKENRYSLMTLDLMMPRLDGVGVLTKLRDLQPDGERPVVVLLTASTERGALVPVAEMVQVVIRKPFDLNGLSELVQDCVNAGKRQSVRPDRSSHFRGDGASASRASSS